MKEITLKVPNIGDFQDVEIIEIIEQPGAQLEVEQPIITLESDKAAIEIPTTHAGTLKKLLVKQGDKISEGTPFAVIEVSEEDAKDQMPQSESSPQPSTTQAPTVQAPTPLPATEPTVSAPVPQSKTSVSSKEMVQAHASPSVRKLARELGVSLTGITATGHNKRILHEDLKTFVKSALLQPRQTGSAISPLPEIDFSIFGKTREEKLTNINKLTAHSMIRSWTTIPHVTQFDQAELTKLNSLKKYLSEEFQADGVKLTFLTLLIKASVLCLKKYTKFNTSISNDLTKLTYKEYFNVAVAVDTEQGLVVPVLKNADTLSLKEIALGLIDLSTRARERKLKKSDIEGASFTISSLGGIGGRYFTPIVNAPEVAILGVSKAYKELALDDKDELITQSYLPVSLSYDHRVIDGALAARFTSEFARIIQEPWELLTGEDKNNALQKFLFPSSLLPTKKKTTKKKVVVKKKTSSKKPLAKTVRKVVKKKISVKKSTAKTVRKVVKKKGAKKSTGAKNK